MFDHSENRVTQLGWLVVALMVVLLVLAACTVPITVPAAAPATSPPTAAAPTATPVPPTDTPEPPTPTPEPPTDTPVPPTPTPEPPTPTATSGAQQGGIDMDAIFPAGYETERTLVINSCSSCHSWVCVVINQRPVAHWGTVQKTHQDLVSGLNNEQLDLVFGFLSENFNDTKPEPELPDILKTQGCSTQ